MRGLKMKHYVLPLKLFSEWLLMMHQKKNGSFINQIKSNLHYIKKRIIFKVLTGQATFSKF